MHETIWKLHIDSNNHPCFIPNDLKFFADKFCCESLIGQWVIPPAKRVDTSKKLADFYSWGQTMAPLVSERARGCISSIAGTGVEFLDFHKVKQHATFVMNVLACEDLLDLQRSSLEVFRERYVFRYDRREPLPPIFKCPGVWGQIFVTTSFGEMLVENALRGAVLADPEEPSMPLILKKARINRFPGLDG